ncbi:MAG: hypothetical protein AAB654_23000 [Acidobacteriota bacterium]
MLTRHPVAVFLTGALLAGGITLGLCASGAMLRLPPDVVLEALLGGAWISIGWLASLIWRLGRHQRR